jgi:predicted DCC family thiol-disulfide oxidoreductase YuxK
MDSAKRTVYYDDTCALCEGVAETLEKDTNLALVGATHELPERISRTALMRDVHAIDEQGAIHRGIDAVIMIMRWHPRWRWFAPVVALPGVKNVGAIIYRIIATNRHRWFRKK